LHMQGALSWSNCIHRICARSINNPPTNAKRIRTKQMPRIKFSQEDLMSSIQLEPAWYKLKVKSIIEEAAKDGDSMNWVVDFVISDGPMVGTAIRTYLNEHGPGMSVRVNSIQSFVG